MHFLYSWFPPFVYKEKLAWPKLNAYFVHFVDKLAALPLTPYLHKYELALRGFLRYPNIENYTYTRCYKFQFYSNSYGNTNFKQRHTTHSILCFFKTLPFIIYKTSFKVGDLLITNQLKWARKCKANYTSIQKRSKLDAKEEVTVNQRKFGRKKGWIIYKKNQNQTLMKGQNF